jgi:hypothetical protein
MARMLCDSPRLWHHGGVERLESLGGDYFKKLGERGKQSKVYKPYQLIGLEVAAALRDHRHKALYIRLAKDHREPERLLALAKDVAGRPGIKNRGAYFMRLLYDGPAH